jgi:hypothetical protein
MTLHVLLSILSTAVLGLQAFMDCRGLLDLGSAFPHSAAVQQVVAVPNSLRKVLELQTCQPFLCLIGSSVLLLGSKSLAGNISLSVYPCAYRAFSQCRRSTASACLPCQRPALGDPWTNPCR